MNVRALQLLRAIIASASRQTTLTPPKIRANFLRPQLDAIAVCFILWLLFRYYYITICNLPPLKASE